MEAAKVLCLDLNSESGSARALRDILESCPNRPIHVGHELISPATDAFSVGEIHQRISRFQPSMLFVLLSSDSAKQATALVEDLNKAWCKVPIIAIVEGNRPEEIEELLRVGVADFIIPPLKAMDVLPRLWRLLGQESRRDPLKVTLREKLGLRQVRDLVGHSPSFVAEMEKIPAIAKCDASVLISGETGTGKELFARAIHYLSPRASRPFIPFSCGAVPVELVENELFGHTQGAFTSANGSRSGLIREGEGGTLFLDEIDCLPLAAQAKLSRFLEAREYRQLGSTKIQRADVRVISATNIDLEQAVKEGRFRQDLYYRLNVIPVKLPSLRQRRDDIPALASYFLVKYSAEVHKQIRELSPEALERLLTHDWAGNVRELKHVIERAVIFATGPVIQGAEIVLPRAESANQDQSFRAMKSMVIAQFEKDYLRELLQVHGGNVSKAARAAKKNRRAFWELIRKHRVDLRGFGEKTDREKQVLSAASHWKREDTESRE